MRIFTFYLALMLCLFASKMLGQQTFEKRAIIIASRIETITKEEKEALKREVEGVNNELINGTISREEAENKKKALAEVRALNIESKVAQEHENLKNLVQEKVDGKIKEQDSTRRYTFTFHKNKHNDTNSFQAEKRTTFQFVFAAGLNNLIKESKLDDTDYRFLGSHFYELGISYNTRIAKNYNFLHAKYGLSLMYNNLRPTNNRNFIVNGNQTSLVINSSDLNESRFRNVYLVVPVHLEFDFSGKKVHENKTFFKTHQSFRLGVGGYAGINLKSKQIIKYDDNDLKTMQKTKGDFNTNNFIYGLSSYIGYRATSLYLKYDLNSLFKDNTVKQNNVSLGLRFDFN